LIVHKISYTCPKSILKRVILYYSPQAATLKPENSNLGSRGGGKKKIGILSSPIATKTCPFVWSFAHKSFKNAQITWF
jgi:hypothetical protein